MLFATILAGIVGYGIYSPNQRECQAYFVFLERASSSSEKQAELVLAYGLNPRGSDVHIVSETTAAIMTEVEQVRNLPDPTEGTNDQIFFFLLDPARPDLKKKLWQSLAESYRGKERVEALRRIVLLSSVHPNSVELTNGDSAALEVDDAIYASDNFGGFGLAIHNIKMRTSEAHKRALKQCSQGLTAATSSKPL